MDYSKLMSERDKSMPLYAQLQASLEKAIMSGDLPAGARLPSERDLATQMELSRTTVVSAYRELESRGLVRSHVGRGTFVCATLEPTDGPFAWRGKVSARVARLGKNMSLRQLMREAPNAGLISFALSAPAFECFPISDYRRAVEQTLRRHASVALGLAPTEGQPQLRHTLARRFGTKPERILILSGSQQGLDLISRCLIDPGDAVIIDRPGYVGAIQTFRAAGANLIGWDAVRADMGELEDLVVRHRPKLIYTDPSFQNPTGRTLTLRDRQDLLKLAARYRIPLVEDDPWRETYLEAPPPPSLYHMDTYNIVIHLGTFSKVLAPGLRLGWLAASEYIVDQLASIKQHENLFTEGLGQFVIADFLRSGLFDNHLVALREEHQKRRDLLRKALVKHLPPRTLELNQPRGGVHFWCRLGNGVEAQPLLQRALLNGVAFGPGEMFYPDGGGRHELRLCFSCVPTGSIEEGVKRLKTAIAADAKRPADENFVVPVV